QAGIADGYVLVRDHNSPDDVLLDDAETLDLAKGNVFYRLKRCDFSPRPICQDAPKLAFFVNDIAEITTRPTQSGKTLRELFGLEAESPLVRDDEDQHDVPVAPGDQINFADGPVFYSREAKHTKIGVTVHNEDNGAEIQLVGTKQ